MSAGERLRAADDRFVDGLRASVPSRYRLRLLAALVIVVLVVFGVYSVVQTSRDNADRIDRVLALLEDSNANNATLRDLAERQDRRLATLEAALRALGINPEQVIRPGDAERLAEGGDAARDAFNAIAERVQEARERERETSRPTNPGFREDDAPRRPSAQPSRAPSPPPPSRRPTADVDVCVGDACASVTVPQVVPTRLPVPPAVPRPPLSQSQPSWLPLLLP